MAVTIPNIPLFGLDVVEDVAVPDPGAGPVEVHEHRVALAGGDRQRVGPVGLVEGDPIAGHDQLGELVGVHGVGLQALVHVVDLDPVTDLGSDRLGGGEALAVEAEADGPGVVEHHRQLLGHLQVGGHGDAPDRAAGRHGHVADQERPEQAVRHGHVTVEVGVVHPHRRLLGDEVVGEALARFDRVLGDAGDPVHGVGQADAVAVHVGGGGQVVGQRDADVVTDRDLDDRARHLAVVGPRLHGLAR